jgi:hypothetical protein
MIIFTPRKIIASSTLKNNNIQAFKNDNSYTVENENILYTGKLYSFSSVEDVIIFHGVNVIICKGLGVFIFGSVQYVIIFHGVNVIIFEGLDVIISSVEDVILFHGVIVIIFEGLHVIIFHFSKHWVLSF